MASLLNPPDWFKSWFKWPFGGSDVSVTAESALRLAQVWYAINKITGHVGQLPVNCMKRLDRGAEYAKNHVGNWLMRTRPNDYQTPLVFKRQLQAHALMWGNGRAAIVRGGNRVITELIPLMPDRTKTFMVHGEKYHVTRPNASTEQIEKYEKDSEGFTWYEFFGEDGVVVLRDEDVLHIPGFSYNGIEGISLFEVARDSWSNALNTNKTIANQSKRGPQVRLLLESPQGQLRSEKDAAEFIENFKKRHNADGSGEQVGLLRDGMKAHVMTMNNRDAQFIEQRVFDRQEAALWFCLESILGDDSSVSYNSLEQKNLAYLSNCLMTWLTTWEEELNWKLLPFSERLNDSHYFKFNVGSLLRADTQTTMTTLSEGISATIISPNEAREKLDMNPREGGDEFANPFTSSPDSGDDAAEDDPPKKEKADDKAARASIRHLIEVEAKRVASYKTSKQFANRVDKFYEGFRETLFNHCDEIGYGQDKVESHIDTSRALILSMIESKADIADGVKSWPDRVDDWFKDSN